MDKKTETLVILMEECGEVIQEASKIIRFGNDPEKLHKELGDLICMIKLTEDNLGLDFDKTFGYSNDKYQKLKSWSNLVGNPERA
jgi:NTP pyrophosphatase (non-canonical NTP hydrolase)